MAPITIEEENFLRIVQLIFGVVVEAVRTVFDKFFSPNDVTSHSPSEQERRERSRNKTNIEKTSDGCFISHNRLEVSVLQSINIMVTLVNS